MKKIVIDNDEIINVVMAAPDWTDPEGRETADFDPDKHAIGYIRKSGEWQKPPEPLPTQGQLENHLIDYRDKRALVYTYKGVPMRLTDGARADLTAVYYMVLLDTAINDDQVMMDWQEEGHDNLPITANMLRTDGHKFAEHRQKCFTAAKTVKANLADFSTFEELEAAFDKAYDSI